jgi:hypothetical protein
MAPGRKDKYAQYFDVALTQPSTDGAIQAAVNLPVPRIPTAGKATIIEIVSIEYGLTDSKMSATGSGQVLILVSLDDRTADASTGTLITQSIYNGHTIDYWILRQHQTTAGGIYATEHPTTHSMETNDGYGFLVATDKLYISMDTTGGTAAMAAVVTVFYRYVEVSVNEYVGIIQSQS